MTISIHAIIFPDKSGTMDFIFRDLHAFSGTDNPPPFFFQLWAGRYIPLCQNPMVQNSKKILILDGQCEIFNFVLLIFL